MTARKTDQKNVWLQAHREMRIALGEKASKADATALMAKVLASIGYRGMKKADLEELTARTGPWDDAYSGKRQRRSKNAHRD